MKNFLSRLLKGRKDNIVTSFSYEQAVIIDVPVAEVESGPQETFNKVKELESAIEAQLPPNSGIDGSEFGEGGATLYVYGPDANTIWGRIEGVLKKSHFNHIEITLQFGRPDDPKTKDKKFTL